MVNRFVERNRWGVGFFTTWSLATVSGTFGIVLMVLLQWTSMTAGTFAHERANEWTTANTAKTHDGGHRSDVESDVIPAEPKHQPSRRDKPNETHGPEDSPGQGAREEETPEPLFDRRTGEGGGRPTLQTGDAPDRVKPRTMELEIQRGPRPSDSGDAATEFFVIADPSNRVADETGVGQTALLSGDRQTWQPFVPAARAPAADPSVRRDHHSVAASAATLVTEGTVQIQVAVAKTVRCGTPFRIRYHVINSGPVELTGVVLRTDLPPKLSYSKGLKLDLTIGRLGPGEVHEARLTPQAEKRGTALVRAEILAEGGVLAKGVRRIEVVPP